MGLDIAAPWCVLGVVCVMPLYDHLLTHSSAHSHTSHTHIHSFTHVLTRVSCLQRILSTYTCSDSFGWSCAAHADMPEHVVARARQVKLVGE